MPTDHVLPVKKHDVPTDHVLAVKKHDVPVDVVACEKPTSGPAVSEELARCAESMSEVLLEALVVTLLVNDAIKPKLWRLLTKRQGARYR